MGLGRLEKVVLLVLYVVKAIYFVALWIRLVQEGSPFFVIWSSWFVKISLLRVFFLYYGFLVFFNPAFGRLCNHNLCCEGVVV